MRHATVEEDLRAITAHELNWTDLEGRTVLVSGAAGFLPAYLVETILYLNETRFARPALVLGLVRDVKKAEARFAHYRGRSDLRCFEHDVCLPLVQDEQVDYIIHAASKASPRFFGVDPAGTLAANVVGTFNLLEFARSQPVRAFLFFSSSEVYGTVGTEQFPLREDCTGGLDPTEVRSCYAESKRMGETMCVAWSRQYGVPAKIVRIFHTYGPGMALDDGRVFADFVANVLAGRDLLLKSDGRAFRAFCYLADAVAGFFTILFKGEPGVAYNLGNEGAETSILDLAHSLAGLLPDRELAVQRAAAPPARGYLRSTVARSCPDTSRLRGLGWQPRTGLREGFLRTIRSFQ